MRIAPLIRLAETFEPAGGAAPSIVATGIANVVLATGFALLLAAAMWARPDRTGWKWGIAWGAAGYAVFFLAPSLGLPPELPGTESAPLRDRQLWWAFTVALSAAGLALAVFGRNFAARLAGVVLMLLPHLVGAPQPAAHGASTPAGLATEFLRLAYVVNAVFWLLLGALVGLLSSRIQGIMRA